MTKLQAKLLLQFADNTMAAVDCLSMSEIHDAEFPRHVGLLEGEAAALAQLIKTYIREEDYE